MVNCYFEIWAQQTGNSFTGIASVFASKPDTKSYITLQPTYIFNAVLQVKQCPALVQCLEKLTIASRTHSTFTDMQIIKKSNSCTTGFYITLYHAMNYIPMRFHWITCQVKRNRDLGSYSIKWWMANWNTTVIILYRAAILWCLCTRTIFLTALLQIASHLLSSIIWRLSQFCLATIHVSFELKVRGCVLYAWQFTLRPSIFEASVFLCIVGCTLQQHFFDFINSRYRKR